MVEFGKTFVTEAIGVGSEKDCQVRRTVVTDCKDKCKMTYTPDQIGHAVREVTRILETVQDADEVGSWISDIIIGASDNDQEKAEQLLQRITDDVEWM